MPNQHPRPIAAGLFGAILVLACGPSWSDEPVPTQESKAEIRTHQVRPGMYVLAGAGGNVAVWTGPDGIVLVDDGLAPLTPQLHEAVAQIAPGPVRFVVNTHWHPDHTGGNEEVGGAGGVIIAHDNVRTRMRVPQVVEAYGVKVPAAARAALPVVTFQDSVSLNLNGDRLEAEHVDAAHTDGDVILWWHEANVVHVGDVFYNGSYPFLDLSSGGSLAGLVAAIEGVLSRADAETVVIPGHGPVSNRAELAAYRDMLVAIGRRVRELVEQGRRLDEVLAARPTAEFDERYGKGSMTAERFVRILYQDLAAHR